MNNLKEALKEGARVVVLAIIPVLLASLQSDNGFDWELVWVTAAIALLRFVDKLLHEEEKTNPNVNIKGIVPF